MLHIIAKHILCRTVLGHIPILKQACKLIKDQDGKLSGELLNAQGGKHLIVHNIEDQSEYSIPKGEIIWQRN
jgi:hypothetical protein